MTGTIVGVSMLVGACSTSKAQTEPRPASTRSIEAIPVTLSPVTSLPSDAPIRATGRVTHVRDLKLGFKTGGIVQELLVDEGERVEVGQVVARLDPRELDAGLAQAKAALTKATRDLKRADALATDDVLPAATRDDAKTAAAVARAQVAGLRFNRDTTTLVSPVAGVVVKRLSEPGEVVGPGMPVLVIGENAADAVRIEVGIPASERLRVTRGAVASVVLAGDETPRIARVVDLAPTLTPGTDRIAVALELTGVPADSAPRGLVVVATFPPRPDVRLPAIPVTTLVEGDGKHASVWVLAPEGRVARRNIRVRTIQPDGQVLVAEGLDGVQNVVDAGSAWLDESTRVAVKPRAEAAHADR